MRLRLFFASIVALAGCASTRSLQPIDQEALVPAAVNVRFRHMIRGDIVGLDVANLSPRRLVVYRDAVRLADQRGEQRRQHGGFTDVYNIEPGEHHLLNVHYALDQIPIGQIVELRFPAAFTIDNQPVPVPPIRFVVR